MIMKFINYIYNYIYTKLYKYNNIIFNNFFEYIDIKILS